MSLREAYVGVRDLETAHNYARADTPLRVQPEIRHNDQLWFYGTDGDFWGHILGSSEAAWEVFLHFGPLALSEWVAPYQVSIGDLGQIRCVDSALRPLRSKESTGHSTLPGEDHRSF